MANIRDPQDYKSTFWNWTPFNECFKPTNIRITDIDGMVERNGLFLVIETKRPNADIPQGQSIMFDHMVETGLFTILIVWGHTDQPKIILKMTKGLKKKYNNCDVGKLKLLIREWFIYADNMTEQDRVSDSEILDKAGELIGKVIQHSFDIQRAIVLLKKS